VQKIEPKLRPQFGEAKLRKTLDSARNSALCEPDVWTTRHCVFAFSWRGPGAGFAIEIKKVLNAVLAVVAGMRREPGFPGYLH